MALIDPLQALLDPNHATAEPSVPVRTVVQASGQQMETVMAALSLAAPLRRSEMGLLAKIIAPTTGPQPHNCHSP